MAAFRIWLIALACACVCATAALAQENEDKGFLARTLQDALSDAGRTVEIDGFRGALSATAAFDQMTIADSDGIWLTLRDVELVWARSALLRGQLQVEKLTAQALDVARLPVSEPSLPDAEAEAFRLPELPVSIEIGAFEVAQITLGAPVLGQPAALRLDARASYTSEALDLYLIAERTDGQRGIFEIKAALERGENLLDVMLRLRESAGGIASHVLNLPGDPSIDLDITGTGTMDDFATDLRLRTDGQDRLNGQIIVAAQASTLDQDTAEQRIRADLGGDITALLAPRYREFFGKDLGLTFDAVQREDGALDVSEFTLVAQAAELRGALRLNQARWPTFIDIEGQILDTKGAAVLLPLPSPTSVGSVTLDIGFDAARGDMLRADIGVSDLVMDAVQIKMTDIAFDGTVQSSASTFSQLKGALAFATQELKFADPALATAVGARVSGTAQISAAPDMPFEIGNLTLKGQDYALNGNAIIDGLEAGFATKLEMLLEAQTLTRFAALVGQRLEGAAQLDVKGDVTPLSGQFDLSARGKTQDLRVGVSHADALLRGTTTVNVLAKRDETGTHIRDLVLSNRAALITGAADLRSAASTASFMANLTDVAVIAPQYNGPLSINAAATQDTIGWKIDARATGPYGTSLSAQGRATGPVPTIDFALTAPNVRPYAPGVNGAASARGSIRQTAQGIIVETTARGPFNSTAELNGLVTGPNAAVDYTISMPDVGALVDKVTGPLSVSGNAQKQGTAWQINTDARGPSGTQARIAGRVNADGTLNLTAQGSAPLGLSGPFIAPRSLQGQADFDLSINGAPNLDALSGTIVTRGATLTAPTIRIGLKDIAARIALAQGRATVDLNAQATNGGQITTRGVISLAPSVDADLDVALGDVVLVDPRLYRTSLSGGLRVNGALTGGARISGQLQIGETNISVPSTGLTSIGDIPTIDHIADSVAVAQTRNKAGIGAQSTSSASTGTAAPNYALDLDITAPRQIFVRGRGLDAELGGGLRLTGSTNAILSTGRFALLRGRLDILGKRFDLVEGSIQFEGDFIPYLRFVSTTTTSRGEASVTVEGPADAPEVTFSASPEAPQDEVLSQLLFGRNLADISAFQALELANAVAILAGRGGVGLISNLRDGFGLDDFDVSTTDSGETALRAGKYLTENVYTDVTAVSDGTGEVSLNIDLTPNLKGKASLGSDGNSGIGLFFEKDY